MKAPRFWWEKFTLLGLLLAPLGHLYGRVAANRMNKTGHQIALPVICVGNLVAGGAGKTPTAIMIATLLKAGGYKPVFLTRGYRGTEKGPLHVDLARHSAKDVGDEAPLLARVAPTIVAQDRVKGAAIAKAYGNVIVMDDGLQNPSLQKDFSIAVIDSGQGVGNGRVIPAGPLRAPLEEQFNHVDACMIIGDMPSRGVDIHGLIQKPIYHARLVPDNAQIDLLQGLHVLAFAGIGRPEKFFETLETTGAILAATKAFPDHHVYTQDDLQKLLATADAKHLTLMTTAKDAVRIAAIAPEIARRIDVLDVYLDCSEAITLMGKLVASIAAKTVQSN